MTKAKIDILFFVEHIARELDVANVVAEHIRIINPTVKIVIASALYQIRETVDKYEPNVVVTPYCYAEDSFIYRHLLPVYGCNVRYINLAYEQICSRKNIHKKLPTDSFSKKHVKHVVWSNYFAELMREVGVRPEKIVVNGNPNFNLLTDEYKSYYPDRESIAQRFSLDTSKKWIFIPENYGPVFWSEHKINAKIAAGFSERFVKEYVQISKDSFTQFLSWIAALAESDTYQIILRPKPTINLASYQEYLSEHISLDNILVTKSMSIRDWIHGSDIVLSNLSTSVLDAVVANKHAALVKPIKYPSEYAADWHDEMTQITSYEDLKKFIQQPHTESIDRIRSWVGDYFNHEALKNLAEILIQESQFDEEIEKFTFRDFPRAKNHRIYLSDDDLEKVNISDMKLRWAKVIGKI